MAWLTLGASFTDVGADISLSPQMLHYVGFMPLGCSTTADGHSAVQATRPQPTSPASFGFAGIMLNRRAITIMVIVTVVILTPMLPNLDLASSNLE